MNAEPGGLTVVLDDNSATVSMTGGDTWVLPIGPKTLVENELERSDRPSPAQLTNALGIAHDHFDDIVIAAPMVAAAPSVHFSGDHALAVARVELGLNDVPDGYQLTRADADEVFRTLVAEPIADRLHNPGLPAAHVESIIGTLCVILAIVRRLDMQQAGIG